MVIGVRSILVIGVRGVLLIGVRAVWLIGVRCKCRLESVVYADRSEGYMLIGVRGIH